MRAQKKRAKCIVHAKTSFRSFTLLELIVVIIIIGILATVGLAAYTNQIEYSRTAEARGNIGIMRKLAYEYYLKNSTLDGMQDSDVGLGSALPSSCASTHFYRYVLGNHSTYANLVAFRCTIGGKIPTASRDYHYGMSYYPSTGESNWYCFYVDDDSPCFGLASP